MNTWESYKKYKQRRATRDSEDNNNQAFAMLVSNAINVATNPGHPQEPPANEKGPDTKETVDEVEEKPRTNRYINRVFASPYSWVSRDVITSLGVNSKSMHSHRREIIFLLYVLTLCLEANMCNFVRFFHSSTA